MDVSGSYPTTETTHNISKETTHKELVCIEGISDYQRRMQGINFSGGASNSVEFCQTLFKMPSMTQMLEAYRAGNAYKQAIDGMELIGFGDEEAAEEEFMGFGDEENEDDNAYSDADAED